MATLKGGLLEGFRVVEIGDRVASALAGKFLAEMGADVVRLEEEGADAVRGAPPFIGGADRERSALHLFLNAAKRSVAGGARLSGTTGATSRHGDQEGEAAFIRLVRGTDVVISGLNVAAARERGVGPSTIRDINPRAIVVEVTSFGQYGPYASYRGDEAVLLAAGGIMHMTGEAGAQPWATFGHTGEQILGTQAAMAGLAALAGRELMGIAQAVDIAGMETAMLMLEQAISLWTMNGTNRGRAGNGFFTGGPVCQVYECADGHFMLDLISQPQWELACSLIGKLEWLDDPRLQDWNGRAQYGEEVIAGIQAWMKGQKKLEVFERFQTYRTVGMPVLTLDEVLRDPQHEARGFFHEVEHPIVGKLRYPRLPFRAGDRPTSLGRAPLFGEHTGSVLNEWNERVPRTAIARRPLSSQVSPRASAGRLPLDSVRVLDLTLAWAGPLCAQILAHLGAEVIKVEGASRPDMMRMLSFYGEVSGPAFELGPFFHTTNYNKLSLSLQLDTAEGRQVFLDLVAHADVVIENFTPRVIGNLGLTYDELRRVRPDLIMLSAPGFGKDGPYENYGGHGEPMEGISGLTALTGPEDRFYRTTVALTDALTSFNAAIALLGALIDRQHTGEGRYIDVSHFEIGSRIVGEELLAYQASGVLPRRQGNRDQRWAPQGCYRCRGYDAWVFISVRSDDEWRRLAALVGDRALVEDAALARVAGRRSAHDRIDGAIAAWTGARDKFDVMNRCQAAGVTASVVYQPGDLVADRHLLARDAFAVEEHPYTGRTTLPGVSFKLSETPPGIYRKTPLFGEHTDQILREICGYASEKIAGLRASGVVGGVPVVG